jgi:hypothetical protein
MLHCNHLAQNITRTKIKKEPKMNEKVAKQAKDMYGAQEELAPQRSLDEFITDAVGTAAMEAVIIDVEQPTSRAQKIEVHHG